jgi:hypothetical protein
MKLKITIGLFILSTAFAKAQSTDNYLLLNTNISKRQNFQYYNQYNQFSSYSFQRNILPRNLFSLQYVKHKDSFSANRFGIDLFSTVISSNGNSSFRNDTNFYSINQYEILVPKLTYGKEWRKYLHKDIMLFAGGDAGLGLTRTGKMVYNGVSTFNSSIWSGSQNSSVWAGSISAKPFIGIRSVWNRFVVGYEASLPLTITKVFDKGVRPLVNANFEHKLSIGYAFKNKKKKS